MELKDSVSIITGGASGLGEATTRKFHSLGSKVCVFDLDNLKGKNLEKELGDNCAYFSVDVCNETDVETAINTVLDRFNKININVNCAGIALAEKTLGKEGPHNLLSFKKIIDVNLIGTFNILRLCAEQMAKNPLNENEEKGIIINTASVPALEGQKGQVAYAASKGGVAAMTLPIARDLAREHIRCGCIAPGLFLTPMFEGLGEEVCQALAKDVVYPKRLGNSNEFAEYASQIVQNNYINGSVMRLDGGIRLA